MHINNHWLKNWLHGVCGSILLYFFIVFFAPISIFAATGINEQIHFQGKVVNSDGTNVANGDYDFVFKIYTVDSGGVAVWTETRETADQVTVTDGIFSVNLGSVTALPGSIDFNTDNIFLGIEFNGDGEMSPRVQFTAVPYAHNAAKVGGLTVTDTTGTLTIPNGTTIAFSGANNLTLTTSGVTTLTLPTTGTLATLAGAEALTNKSIGSTGLTFSGATTDITTGTDEHLVIEPNGTGNVGIGTTTVSELLHVDGNIRANGSILGDAVDRGTAGALAIGNTTATSVSICNSASCDTITIGSNADADTITIGDSLDGLSIASTGLNVTSGGAISGVTTLSSSGDWTWTATTPNITVNSAEVFTITDGTDTFTVNTSGSLFSFSDGSNGFSFDADTGPSFSGSARPARKDKFVPEYPGAVITGDGGSNTGTMSSDFCEQGAHADIPDTNTSVCNTSGDIHNYYSWTTNQGTAQDYDVWVRWRVPDNFAAWDSNPIQIYGKRTDTTNNAITAFVYDTTGALNNAGGTQIAGTTWTQTAVSLSGGTWTAGSYITIRLVLTADTGSDSVQLGEINLNYLTSN